MNRELTVVLKRKGVRLEAFLASGEEIDTEDLINETADIIVRENAECCIFSCTEDTKIYGIRLINSLVPMFGKTCTFKTICSEEPAPDKTGTARASASEEFRRAMENGYLLYRTGLYPAAVSERNLMHIGISGRDIPSFADLCFMGPDTAFFIRDEVFDQDRYEQLLEIPGLLSHFHFMKDECEPEFDDTGLGASFDRCSFSEFANRKISDTEINGALRKISLVTVSSEEDYRALKTRSQNFAESGDLKDPLFYIENECRFSGVCTLGELHRMDIDDSGQVYPCGREGFLLGNAGDGCFTLTASAAHLKNIKRKERNCAECSAFGSCTECLNEPESEGNRFCTLMKESGPKVRDYLLRKNTLAAMYGESPMVRGASHIRLPGRYWSRFFSGPETGNDETENHFLICIDDGLYYLDGRKNALIRMDRKLFHILEGRIRAADRDSIIASISSFEKLSLEEAETIYFEGTGILERAGVIK